MVIPLGGHTTTPRWYGYAPHDWRKGLRCAARADTVAPRTFSDRKRLYAREAEQCGVRRTVMLLCG
jgi:hypothetical protein